MRDALLNFGTINLATTPAGPLPVPIFFPDIIDLGVAKDLGQGEPICVEFEVLTSITDSASGPDTQVLFSFGLWTQAASDTAAASASPRVFTGSIANHDWAGGDYSQGRGTALARFFLTLPPLPDFTRIAAGALYADMERYLAAGIVVTTSAAATLNVGTVRAAVVPLNAVWRTYASGFTV